MPDHVMQPHITYIEDDSARATDQFAAMIHPASPDAAARVLAKPENTEDGRSRWVWVRFQNGDLCLGTFPYGETYFDVEVDAEYPHDYPPNAIDAKPKQPADPEAFKAELKALLLKYRVTIQADVGSGSDTHGIYGEEMSIEGHWQDKDRIRITFQGWEISANDL